MYQSDTEMLFPSRVIPALKYLRGAAWRSLVERVARQEDGARDDLAFSLMMIRLNGCLTCHADSYRAMRGCTACAQQSVGRCKETDAGMVKLFREAQKDVDEYLKHGVMLQV
jgi:hypothetical protein